MSKKFTAFVQFLHVPMNYLAITRGLIILNGLFLGLVACQMKKPSCIQTDHLTAFFENHTDQEMELEVIYKDFNSEIKTTIITLAVTPEGQTHVLDTQSRKIEGDYLGGKWGHSAICSKEPSRKEALLYLTKNSFSKVKNCVDEYIYWNFFVSKSQECPEDSHEQLKTL